MFVIGTMLAVCLCVAAALQPTSQPTRARVSLSVNPSPSALQSLAKVAKDDIRGIVSTDAEVPLMPESAFCIGTAFRKWLGSDEPIVVGCDPRTSSDAILAAFCSGAGAYDVGLSTTPAMLESLLEPASTTVGAVMVTASHLPPQYNGLKLFSRQLKRGLNKREVAEVMALAIEIGEIGTTPVITTRSSIATVDGFMTAYIEKLRAAVRYAAADERARPLEGMIICVNPGSGSGGFFATQVLEPLGADTSASVNLEPDGSFPAHMPNPEDDAHVRATIAAVAASAADVGVMLDTDVDRCGLIDGCTSPPEPVNRNRLIALCAMDALEANNGRGVIVTDSVTSKGMPNFISQRGGSHDRYKMGYRNVIDRAAETTPEPALLAIETSGHSAWRDNAFVDDGCYTAARLIGRLARERRESGNSIVTIEGGKGFSGGDATRDPSPAVGGSSPMASRLGLLELLGGSLEEPIESIKVKMTVGGGLGAVPDAEAALCAALGRAAEATGGWAIEAINHDGLRCAVGDSGWLIIRGSLHEPSVSVQTESDDVGGTARICATLLEFVLQGGECEAAGMDVQPLRTAAA